jgi:hypothetical protein
MTIQLYNYIMACRAVPCKRVIRRTTEQEYFSWNGVAVQKGIESGSRGLVIVKSRYQETTSEDPAGWKRLSVCASDL